MTERWKGREELQKRLKDENKKVKKKVGILV